MIACGSVGNDSAQDVADHFGKNRSELTLFDVQSGKTIQALGRTFPLVGNRHRWLSAIRQMLAIGVDAVPMVGIMACCAGFILAMQGASELRRFGAMQFVTDLVTIGFTRELGPLLTAIAVSLGGLISFAGLIVPHVARLLLGPDHVRLLPVTALAGAIFLVITDTIARTLFAPTELPVGAMTAIAGAPVFIYLLRRRLA